MDWFSVMATQEEMEQLKSATGRVRPPEGEGRRIAEKLDRLIQDRFVKVYKDEGIDVPKNLKKKKQSKKKQAPDSQRRRQPHSKESSKRQQ